MFWDFIGLRPETTHQVSFLFSDRGIPDGYRHMNGYGSHTFKNVNDKGQAVYVKYHLKTDQGIRNLTTSEADQQVVENPDYSISDLYNAIGSGNYPSWTVYIQVMTFEQAENWKFNPFDLTKVWPHSEFPLIEVGRMVLNRNPENYFAEIEQLAFSPAHLVPGIEPSPDKMLQGRLFSYTDTHRHRLGPNYLQIPVNRPLNTQVLNYQRDGPMTVNSNQAGAPNYFPNSFNGPQPDSNARWHSHSFSGDVTRYNSADEDNFTQVGHFYRNVLTEEERERLTFNIANSLAGAQEFIQERAISNFSVSDPDYGNRIREKLRKIKAQRKNPKVARAPAPLNPPRRLPNCPYQSKL